MIYTLLGTFKIMFKWIKNSKGAITNKGTNLKGISVTKDGNYKAFVGVRNKGVYKPSKAHIIYIGTYKSVKEAKQKRVEYILSLL